MSINIFDDPLANMKYHDIDLPAIPVDDLLEVLEIEIK